MKVNKLISVVLCIAMVFSTMSFSVFSAEDGIPTPIAVEQTIEAPVAEDINEPEATETNLTADEVSEWTENNSLPTSGTYKLMNDITLTSDYMITLTDDLTLDLNGFKVTDATNKVKGASTITVPSGVTFVVEDNSENKEGSIEFNSSERIFDRKLINLSGTLVLKSGKIVNKTFRGRAVFSSGSGKLEVTGGEIVNEAQSGYCTYFYGSSSINITNAKFTCTDGYALYAMGSTTVNISNSEIKSENYGDYAIEMSGKALTITNSTISNTASNGRAISLSGNAAFSIDGDSLISNTGSSGVALYVSGSTLELTDINIENSGSSSTGIQLNNGADVTLVSGTIKNNASSTWGAVYCAGNTPSSFTMNGGKILNEGTSPAVNISKGDLLINGGYIEQKCTYSSECAVEIGNSVNSAEFRGGEIVSATVGIQSWNKPITITGGKITATYPLHARNVTVAPAEESTVEMNATKALLYTLSEPCSINIEGGSFEAPVFMEAYSGELPAPVVSGGTFAADLDVKDYVGSDYEIKENSDGSYSVGKVVYVASVEGVEYTSIQAAIDAANASGEITLLDNTAETGITVAADDDVIIDLNGKTVTGDFMVYGKATVKNGTIDSNDINVSALESNGASAELTTQALTVTSERHAIRVDGGKLTVNSGSYTASDYASNHVINISDGGKVTIQDGTFVGNMQSGTGSIAIRDDASEVIINNGTFTGGSIASLTVWGGAATVNNGTFDTVNADVNITIENGTFNTINKMVNKGIKDGKFTNAPKVDYVVEGKYPVKSGDVFVIGDAVAMVTDTVSAKAKAATVDGVYYATFDEAWKDAVYAGGAKTIELIADATHDSGSYSTNMDASDITIDLNGFDLTLNANLPVAGSFYDGGKLTINDSDNTGSVIFNGDYYIETEVDAPCTVVINGGKFVKENGEEAIIRDTAWGTVDQTITINGGDFTGVAGNVLDVNDGDVVTKADSVSVKAPVGYKWEEDTTLVEYVATGNLGTGVYTTERENGVVVIWGDLFADPIQDLYVEILASDGTVMGSVKLNDVGGIYDKTTVDLTWHMMVAGDEYDTYWTTTWNEGYPNVKNQPANAVLYVDGVKVDIESVQMNSADNLKPLQWKNFFPCAVIGETQYNSIQAAVNAAANDDVITLISDRITDGGVNIPADKNVVIDLAGYTVTGYFWVNGEAEFKNGTIDASNLGKSAIEINSSETIDGTKGTFAPKLTLTGVNAISNRHALRIDGGNAKINSGTYQALYSKDVTGYAVNASSGAVVTIEDGTFKSNMEGINEGTFVIGSRNAGTKVTINGGDFSRSTGETLRVSDSGEIVVNAGVYEKDPSAFVVEGKEATYANGVYTINNARKFIVKAIDNDEVKDKTVVAGETVTVEVYLEGTELYGAEWELVYDNTLFSTENNTYGTKFSTTAISKDTPLATYTFTALAQDTDADYTFTLKEGAVAQTNDESVNNIEPTPAVVTDEAKITIKLDTFETEAKVDGEVVSTETNLAEVKYTADEHTVQISAVSVPAESIIAVTVNGNEQVLDETGSFTLTEGGTYTIKYVVTQKGYETLERTFTLIIADPDYVVELAKNFAGSEVNAKNMVLVYTNSEVIGFEYDGATMFDVTYKGYKYNGQDSYAKVYAIVVDNIEGGELAAYEAKVDCICEKTADKFVIKAPNPEHDLTGDGKITISDATTAFGVYRVYSNYYSKYMATVLTADVDNDKNVDGDDTTAYTTAYFAEKK